MTENKKLDELLAGMPFSTTMLLTKYGKELGYSKMYESQEMPKDMEKEIKNFFKSRGLNKRFQKKQCYHNSQIILLECQGKIGEHTIKYCEGLWTADIVSGFPISHGWCVVDAIYVVDPTLELPGTASKAPSNMDSKVFGKMPDDWEYCGMIFELDFIMEQVLALKQTTTFLDDYRLSRPMVMKFEKLLAEKRKAEK